MLTKQLSFSCIKHLKSRAFTSQFGKVKPSFDESPIEKSSPSFNNYKVEKASSISTHLFRRKEGEFIVSEVTTSPSGVTTSRIRNIVKHIKNKWKKIRPSIPKMVLCFIGTVLLSVTAGYFIKYRLSQWTQYVPVRNQLQVGRHMFACTPNLVYRRRPMNPSSFRKPSLPRVAPTFENGVGIGFWARSGCPLMMPQTKFYQDVMAQQFYRRQLSKVLAHRGGELVTPEILMTALAIMKNDPVMRIKLQEIIGCQVGIDGPNSYLSYLSYLTYLTPILGPVAIGAVQQLCYANGYPIIARLIGAIAALNGVKVVGGFSVNPGNPGTPGNPITRLDQIDQLHMPRRQTDKTPMGFIRNGTDLLMSLCTDQTYGKQKHYNGEYCPPGEFRLDVWARMLIRLTLDENTKLYPAVFNDRYNRKSNKTEKAVVAMFINATHKLGITYVFENNDTVLDDNFRFSPENKTIFSLARCLFRTAYNYSKDQYKRLIEEGKVQ